MNLAPVSKRESELVQRIFGITGSGELPVKRTRWPRRSANRYRPREDRLSVRKPAREAIEKQFAEPMSIVASAAILAFHGLEVADQVAKTLEVNLKGSSSVSVPLVIGKVFRGFNIPTLMPVDVLTAAVLYFASLPKDVQQEWIKEVHVYCAEAS